MISADKSGLTEALHSVAYNVATLQISLGETHTQRRHACVYVCVCVVRTHVFGCHGEREAIIYHQAVKQQQSVGKGAASSSPMVSY